ncbi:MAG: hypothetical protein E6I06_05435 [Chloroflexi bacterium]|nr:MAG: hypothetical protein E6I06_05435 [Chloroflexota bacterium]
MDRVTDAFIWPFRDPEWPAKIAVIGLILLIPIVGAVNGLGWMLAALDRLRAGEERLPPANFSYLGRGLSLFAANLFYYLLALLFLSFSILSVGYLALTFATPSIVLAVSRGGIAGGLRVDGVMRSVRRSLVNTLIAGLMLIAAHFVASLGLFVCGIGVVFTNAYALAMQAWIVRSFEIGPPEAG